MSNLATLKGLIIRELHQDASTVSQTVTDDVTLAIIESLNFNRRFAFTFNTGRWIGETIANQYFVELPKTYMGLVGSLYYTPNYSSTSVGVTTITSGSRYPMNNTSVDMIEEYRLKGTDYRQESVTGRSVMYAVDTTARPARILLSPVPTQVDTLDCRMIYDLGIPEPIYSGSAWSYYEAGTETPIVDTTYTSNWFKDGLQLIKYRALYVLWTGVYGGSDESNNMALAALQKWNEEKNRLSGENNRMTSTNTVRKWI